MLRVVRSRLTQQWSRYVLVVICVAVCAAFMTAALGLASTLSAGLASSLAAPYKNADAVVSTPDSEQAPARADAQQLQTIEALPDVKSAWSPTTKMVHAKSSGTDTGATQVNDLPADTSLVPAGLKDGSFPDAANQISVSEGTAKAMNVGVGDTVQLEQYGSEDGTTADYKVSGITDQTASGGVPDWYVTAAGLKTVPGEGMDMGGGILLRTDGTPDGDQLAQLATEINRVLGTGQGGQPALTMQTPDQMAQDFLDDMSQGTDVLAIFLALFAGLSVLVALVVVTNTLSVLTAQRARELALLRCVGATGSQVRRAVLLEGLLLGVVSSVLGVGAVTALVVLARTVVSTGSLELTLAPRDVVVGLVTGVLLTVIASLGPARRARGASALDGLRGSRAADGLPVVRTVFGAGVLIAGAAALVFGATQHSAGWGIAGGLAAFLGAVLTSRAYIPALVRGAGTALPGGIPSRLAAANAARYPTRTSTTATALLIGVLLVSTVLTGEHVARVNLLEQLDQERPVDISVPAQVGDLSQQQVHDLGALIRREALVISLVAAVVGLVAGWLFGVLGVMSLFTEGMTVRPVVPWGGFLLILAGAVVVAVLASALPVRRATRLSPVEGMARAD